MSNGYPNLALNLVETIQLYGTNVDNVFGSGPE
jgi:hypothetical protein